MKKTLKSITAIVMVVAICLCAFTACSGGGSIIGTWKISKASVLGIEIDVINGKLVNDGGLGDMFDEESIKELQAGRIEFTADGKCISKGMSEGEEETSTYELKGNEVYIDDQKAGTFNGNEIVISISGVSMTLVK